jgi:hypothetical protein
MVFDEKVFYNLYTTIDTTFIAPLYHLIPLLFTTFSPRITLSTSSSALSGSRFWSSLVTLVVVQLQLQQKL